MVLPGVGSRCTIPGHWPTLKLGQTPRPVATIVHGRCRGLGAFEALAPRGRSSRLRHDSSHIVEDEGEAGRWEPAVLG